MNSRVLLLPDHVANQIAAGEVIQRPSSVVKELLENAVDAKANKIKLVIKNAGKTLIQVIDNGNGINSHDICIAFERHATSKIKTADDLFKLNTKGFRGEALASIAAISHVELHTKTKNDDVSNSVRIEGSKIVEQILSAKPLGTFVTVKNLFYNVPARRNFLKSDNVELRHIIEEFHRIALSHPEINFKFFNNEIEIFNLSISNFKKRISSILGSKCESYLVPVEENTSLVVLKGFILKPEFSKKSRGHQFFFVNNRFIKSPFLHHAIINAYEGLLKQGFYPGYFLHLKIDPKKIDINIHPTKTEIKFEDEQNIYAVLRSSVKHSLGIFQVIPSLDFEKNNSFEVPYNLKNVKPTPPKIEVNPQFNPFKVSKNIISSKIEKHESFETEILNIDADSILNTKLPIESPKENRVYQLFSKYIVCPLQTSMIIIDQNRAHQRILYEDFLSSMTTKKNLSQQLLFPLKIKLNAKQALELDNVKEIIDSIGFKFELKKNHFLEIYGSPQQCPESKIKETLESLLSGENIDHSIKHFSQADHMSKKLAKKLAIRSGDYLEKEELQVLLNKFFDCKETQLSPFNKPIFISLEKTEIEQKLN